MYYYYYYNSLCLLIRAILWYSLHTHILPQTLHLRVLSAEFLSSWGFPSGTPDTLTKSMVAFQSTPYMRSDAKGRNVNHMVIYAGATRQLRSGHWSLRDLRLSSLFYSPTKIMSSGLLAIISDLWFMSNTRGTGDEGPASSKMAQRWKVLVHPRSYSSSTPWILLIYGGRSAISNFNARRLMPLPSLLNNINIHLTYYEAR